MSRENIIEARVRQEEIPGLYGKIAPFYDAWAALTETRARKAALRAAAIRDGERILEVAVGTGGLFRKLVLANPNGVTEGVDLTEGMLARARRKVADLPGRHNLQVGDAHALPFAGASFDLVVNNYMFDLLPARDFGGVLGEMRRVLAPGGRLVLVNMARGGGLGPRIYTWLYERNARWMGGCRGVEMAPYVEAQGFRDVKVERLTQLGFPSELVTARA
jgi:ubiquinone/menaquinone biosynthesis C-methylase UbiE